MNLVVFRTFLALFLSLFFLPVGLFAKPLLVAKAELREISGSSRYACHLEAQANRLVRLINYQQGLESWEIKEVISRPRKLKRLKRQKRKGVLTKKGLKRFKRLRRIKRYEKICKGMESPFSPDDELNNPVPTKTPIIGPTDGPKDNPSPTVTPSATATPSATSTPVITPSNTPTPYLSEADFYLDADNGDDNNDGSTDSPWQTVDRALEAAAGSIVEVRAGDYGVLHETASRNRTEYLTLRAAKGAEPLLSGIVIDYPALEDAYLKIAGFKITSAAGSSVVRLKNTRYLELVNNKIASQKYCRANPGRPGAPGCAYGVSAFNISNLSLKGNRISNTHRGAVFNECEDVEIIGNYITPVAGTAIFYGSSNSNFLIHGNHIHGTDYVSYPTDPDAPNSPHASIISIRSGDLTISGNIMHSMGSSSGIMFYEPDSAGGSSAYSNVLFENNQLYNTINSYAFRIYNLGSNVVLRNNLIYSHYRTGTCDGHTNDARYRYHSAFTVHSLGAGSDGSSLSLWNNILIGITAIPDAADLKNNVIWSLNQSGWRSVPLNGSGNIVLVDSYRGCGNHPDDFEDGSLFTDSLALYPALYDVVDYSLSANSIGINFGDSALQPNWSLGTLNENGFIQDNGKLRNATTHSVGPLEINPEQL